MKKPEKKIRTSTGYEDMNNELFHINFRNLTASPLFEKKLWLLPLSEIYKGKEIIVYISIPYITFPKTSTNNALFQGFSQSKCKIIK